MRQQVDLAVLHIKANQVWFEPAWRTVQDTLTRVVIHDLAWELQGEFPAPKAEGLSVDLRTDLLHHAAVRFRRYDAVLLSVSMETLAWTRRLLGSIPRGPSVPVIGVLHDVAPAGMIDVLELGMIDFVKTPLEPGELRARILCAVSRAPRRLILHDHIRGYIPGLSRRPRPVGPDGFALSDRWFDPQRGVSGAAMAEVQPTTPASVWGSDPLPRELHRQTGRAERLVEDLPMVNRLRKVFETPQQTFAQMKSRMIAEFEAQYVLEALTSQSGNVARAAAACGKNRRAFWEIMRKHNIDAKPFRNASSEA